MKKTACFVLALVVVTSCHKTKWKCDEEVSYKNDIQPLFDAHCNKCHSYTDYADAQSLAVSGRLSETTIKDRRMPPSGEKKLTSKERKKIYCWIEGGALDN